MAEEEVVMEDKVDEKLEAMVVELEVTERVEEEKIM